MACRVSLGDLNKKYILYPIISIILLINKNFFFYKTNLFDNIDNHLFIKIISKSLGKSLLIFTLCLTKKENRFSSIENLLIDREVIYKKEYINYIEINEKRKNIIKYAYIFFTSLINFCEKVVFYYLGDYNNNKLCSLWILNTIFVCILSYFILNKKLFRHQYFSIIIITILGIILNIINDHNKEIHYIKLLIQSLSQILFSLNLVLNKYFMDKFLFSEYDICYYEGILCEILSIICLVVFTKYEIRKGDIIYKNKHYVDNFNEYLDNINTKEIFAFIYLSISHLIIYLFILKTMKYYSIFQSFIILIFDEGDYYSYDLKDCKLFVNLIIYLLFIFLNSCF